MQEHHARRLHWDFRLERDGVLVSWALPKGVPDDPGVNHLAVHTEDHPLEYAGFHGEIPRGEYGGGAVTIWDHGTYDVLKWDEREVKVNLHGERLAGGYALFATGGKNWMIHRERLPLPATLTPMLAVPGEPPSRDLAALVGGVQVGRRPRPGVHRGGRLRLVSRTGKDITATYPEVAGLGHAIGAQAGAARRRDRGLLRRPPGLRGAPAPDARLLGRPGRPAGGARPRSPTWRSTCSSSTGAR